MMELNTFRDKQLFYHYARVVKMKFIRNFLKTVLFYELKSYDDEE